MGEEAGQRKLLELGIRAKLKRPLHWRQNCCICYCIMSPLTGISGDRNDVILCCSSECETVATSVPCAGLYGFGLLYGGPAVLVWGWILASILTFCAALVLSELSSAFPVSGGLYFWAFMLGGHLGPLASWCVGWTNVLGQARMLNVIKATQCSAASAIAT